MFSKVFLKLVLNNYDAALKIKEKLASLSTALRVTLEYSKTLNPSEAVPF
jgi:hypothetical protein